jgi:hypothetical protein
LAQCKNQSDFTQAALQFLHRPFSIILVILLSACQTDTDLKGTWIGEYSSSVHSENRMMIFPVQNLITFENNKAYAQGSDRYFGNNQIRVFKPMFLQKDMKSYEKLRKPVVCDYFGLIKLSGFFLFISSLLVVMLSGLQGYNNLRLWLSMPM